MTKKGNNIIVFLVMIIAILMVVAMVIFGTKEDSKSITKYFNDADKVGSSKLYEDILALSEDNYPSTPKDVVDIYLKGYKLLYGDRIKDLSIVESILEKQRLLLSNEILESTPLDMQTQTVLDNIEELKKQKIKTTQIFAEESEMNPSKNTREILVKIQDDALQQYEYIYTLEKNDYNMWKILYFENIGVNKIE